MSFTKGEQKALLEGFAAGGEGLSFLDCPYEKTGWMATAWLVGWARGRRDARHRKHQQRREGQ